VGTRNAVPPYITPTTLSDSQWLRFGPHTHTHTHYEYSHDTLRVRDVQAGNKIGGKSGINWAALDKGERGVSKHAHMHMHLQLHLHSSLRLHMLMHRQSSAVPPTHSHAHQPESPHNVHPHTSYIRFSWPLLCCVVTLTD